MACSVVGSREQPTSSAADAPRIVRPKSLRLSTTRAGLTLGAGPQVPHPVELQVPHALPELLSTFKEVVIAISDLPSKELNMKSAVCPIRRLVANSLFALRRNVSFVHLRIIRPANNPNGIVPHL